MAEVRTRSCPGTRLTNAAGRLRADQTLGWTLVATLWAISDLHNGHVGNKPITESLYPSSPDDWLIVAGDVAERTDAMIEKSEWLK